MKVRGILYIVFMVCLMAGCQDDFEEGFSGEGGMTEGMVTFRFGVENAAEIYTRSEATDATDAEKAIENVLLVVMDASNTVTKNAYFESLSGGNSVRMYLSAGTDEKIYAFCNIPLDRTDENNQPISVKQALLDADNLTELQAVSMTIETEDGANASSGFVMSGDWDVPASFDENATYEIEVARLAAKLEFKVYFMPDEETDEFAITGMFMYNIPKGSLLLAQGYPDSQNAEAQELNAGTDYVKGTEGNYFNWGTEKNDEAGYRIDYEPQTYDGGKEYNYATFYQFENRRGAVYDDYDSNNGTGGENWTGPRDEATWTLDDGTTWNDLASLRGQKGANDDLHYSGKDLFESYRQINKRILAHFFERKTEQGYTDDTYKGFPGASYLVIEGVYQRVNAVGKYEASKVRYYVYLGKDNYADFNVKRNHNYIYDIKIYTEDKYDTRVYSEAQGNLAIYYDNAILDAHFNVLQTLLYSQTNWTARVVDPDETPWLEISTSPSYIRIYRGVISRSGWPLLRYRTNSYFPAS